MGLGTSDRLGPFLKRPSQATIDNLKELQDRTFFLVGRPGPTCFTVQEESQLTHTDLDQASSSEMDAINSIINDTEEKDIEVELERLLLEQNKGNISRNMNSLSKQSQRSKKHKVIIGHRQYCSCGGGISHNHKSASAHNDMCAHLLFVLHRVLGVPQTNPILWQVSLTERELDEALRCEHLKAQKCTCRTATGLASLASSSRINDKASTSTRSGEVAPRPLSEDTPCPICYDNVNGCAQNLLVYCRFSCGNWIHGHCMRIWAKHQTQGEKELTCPMCRMRWGSFDWIPPRGSKSWSKRDLNPHRAAGVHYGISCNGCKQVPLHGKRFRCIICKNYNLCNKCFYNEDTKAEGVVLHGQHPFVMIEEPGGQEQTMDREIAITSIDSLKPSNTTAAEQDALLYNDSLSDEASNHQNCINSSSAAPSSSGSFSSREKVHRREHNKQARRGTDTTDINILNSSIDTASGLSSSMKLLNLPLQRSDNIGNSRSKRSSKSKERKLTTNTLRKITATTKLSPKLMSTLHVPETTDLIAIGQGYNPQ